VKNIHHNYDAVFKDALTLFKDKALDFLGITHLAPIAEPLSTESVQVAIKSEFRDLVFATQDKNGVHLEEEVDLSTDDLLRFCNYNVGLQRIYKRDFTTIILVKNSTTLTKLDTACVQFSPIIVQCTHIDADALLEQLHADITAGKPINELQLVYLPLFASKKYSPTELFKESTQLINEMNAQDELKRKLYALITALARKIVPFNIIKDFLKEVDMRDNVIIRAAEEIGEERGEERATERIALNLIKSGIDSLDVVAYTGLSVDQVRILRETVQREETAKSA